MRAGGGDTGAAELFRPTASGRLDLDGFYLRYVP
jgi:hypothetical protein